MNVVFTLQEIAVFILFLLAVGVGVYLIIALRNINSLTREINQVVEANRSSIDLTLSYLPEISENLRESSIGIRKSVCQTEAAIDVLTDNVTDAVTTVNKAADSITTYSVIVTEIVKTLMDMFAKAKK
jgi:predicted PurR-regulated permease PerM